MVLEEQRNMTSTYLNVFFVASVRRHVPLMLSLKLIFSIMLLSQEKEALLTKKLF